MSRTKRTRPKTAATVRDARQEVHNTSDSTPAKADRQAPIPPNIAELARRIAGRPHARQVMAVIAAAARKPDNELRGLKELAERLLREQEART